MPHKIARIIVSGKQYKDDGKPILSELKNVLISFVGKTYSNMNFEFIVTPGGFLNFEWPCKFAERIDNDVANSEEYLQIFYKAAESKIKEFFGLLRSKTFKKLKKTADYFTIGIDSKNSNNGQHIELVAIFDLKESKVIHWTGKFYPTKQQETKLIKINDLNTHFVQLNNQKILILVCHDINVFHPRGQARAKDWRRGIAKKFKEICRDPKFKPDIILHYPHATDTPNTWNLPWRTIEEELARVEHCVKHYASGIKYYNPNGGPPRKELKKVLEGTKRGDVIDFVYVK